MSICGALLICDAEHVEMIAVTLVSIGPVIYFAARYDRSAPRSILYGLLSLLAYPVSFGVWLLMYWQVLPFLRRIAFGFPYPSMYTPIVLSLGLVLVVFAVSGAVVYRFLQHSERHRSLVRFVAAYCFGIVAGWIAALIGSPLAVWIWSST